MLKFLHSGDAHLFPWFEEFQQSLAGTKDKVKYARTTL